MILPIIKDEYIEKVHEFFFGTVQGDLYQMLKTINKGSKPPAVSYSERFHLPPIYSFQYAALLYEVIYRISLGYKKRIRYTILEKGDSIGKFSYDQLQGSDVFNYIMVTHPIRKFLMFLTDNKAPIDYELTSHFVVAPVNLSINPILRQHALGNAVELQFVDGNAAVKFMVWVKKEQKANPELFKEMVLFYVPEKGLLRIIGQSGETQHGHYIRRLVTLKNRTHRGEQIKTWIKPTI